MLEKLPKKINITTELAPFELKFTRLWLFVVPPCVYIYSLLILHINPNAYEVPYVKEVLLVIMLASAFIINIKKPFFKKYNALIAFLPTYVFNHYLIYVLFINGFTIDYLLATYVLTFIIMILINDRFVLLIFSITQVLHILYRIQLSNLDGITQSAIIISIIAILIFSLIMFDALFRYKDFLLEANSELENTVRERTKNLEQKTEDLEERALELKNKNEDLEQFAYVISHDLKRPLRSIYTLSQWTTEDYKQDLNKGMLDNLNQIREQAFQMEKLIEGILSYSLHNNTDSFDELIDLNETVSQLIKADKSNNVQIKILNKLPSIYFNDILAIQVFQNLIENAITYNDKLHTIIEIDFIERASVFEFSVKDNGPGIPEKYHKKVFQLFQRLDKSESAKNIGIGLAMVKKIIENLGGKIWIESELNHSTTIYYTILKSNT